MAYRSSSSTATQLRSSALRELLYYATGGVESKRALEAKWVNTCHYYNRTSSPEEITVTCDVGCLPTTSYSQEGTRTLTTGVQLPYIRLDGVVSLSLRGTEQKQSIRMTQSELNETRTIQKKVIVQPGKTYTGWQLFVCDSIDTFRCDNIADTFDDEKPPVVLSSSFKVLLPREIVIGETEFQIMHKATKKKLIVTTHSILRCPAANLGQSGNFYYKFVHVNGRPGQYMIAALNSTNPQRNILYAVDDEIHKPVRFDNYQERFNKQYWFLSQPPPLYDGEVVTFRNVKYNDRYMCVDPKDENQVNVKCFHGREDEWVLIVKQG